MKVFAVLSILLTAHSTSGQIFEACQPYYPVTVDTQFTGGVSQTSVTTEAACKTACDADPGCVGFDIDTRAAANPYCSLTNDPSVVGAALVGVNHYTRSQACPFPLSSERCLFSYLGEKEIVASQQGPLRGADRTASDCMGSCMNVATCAAAIYSTTTKQCHIDFTTVVVGSLTDKTGNQFYESQPCSIVPLDGTCTDTYIMKTNFAKANGQYVTNNNTQMECELTCNGTDTCLGFDFDRGASVCFMHSDAKQSESVKTDVDNYRKAKECTTAADTCSYKTFLGYIPAATYAGTPVSGIISLSECLAACNQDGDSCVGITFNTNFASDCQKYLKATATTTPTVTQNMNAFIDLTNLQVSTSGQVGYGRDSCAATTTASPTTSPGSCAETYRMMPGKKLNGGQLTSTNPSDITGCKLACTANPACWGVDFNTGDNSCWSFFDNTVTPYTPPIDSTIGTETHYEKYWTCADCEYNIINAKESSLRIIQSAFTTLDTCLNACSGDNSCKGVDYKTDTNTCYFHTAPPTPASTSSNSLFKQYLKISCSGTAVGGCDFNKFKLYANKKISGGFPVSTSPKNLANCEIVCIGNPACFSFDLDGSSTCWIVTAYGEIADGATGENHYHREPVCSFTNNADCKYFFTGKFEPNDGTAKISTTTKAKELCFESCIDVNSCSGLTWTRDTQSCVLYNTQVTWNAASLKDSTNSMLEGYKFNGCATTGTTVGTTTISISTTTGAGGCVGGTWVEFPEMHANGGLPKQEFTTKETCRQGCIDNPDCVGVDVDATSGGPLCWFHLSQSNIDGRTAQTGTILNVLTRCSDVTTPSSSVCMPAYMKDAQKKQANGVLVSGVNTLNDCETSCESQSACVAFDYERVQNQCYTHTTIGTVVDSGAGGTEPVDHYRKNWDCAGCNYKNYPGKRFATGGDPMSPYKTLDACLKACAGHATCIAIDFRANPQVCDFYYSPVKDNLITAADHQHWANDGSKPCTGTTGTGTGTTVSGGTTMPPSSVCMDDYQLLMDTKKFNGQPVTAAGTNSVDGCKTWCNGQATCAAFDYSPSANACWWHTSTDQLVAATDGANHYAKSTTCGECSYDVYVQRKVSSIIGTDSTQPTKSSCLVACNENDNCKSVDYDGTSKTCSLYAANYTSALVTSTTSEHYEQFSCPCSAVMEYDVDKDSKVNQGQKVNAAGSVAACEEDCDTDANCIGFDFNAQDECWKTVITNKNPVVGSGEGVDHYTKFATCGGCRYDIYGGTAVSGGTGVLQAASINTWKACVSACTTESTCLSLDFNSNNKHCYHFTATLETGLTSNNDVIHYVKKNCDQNVTPTGGSTDSTTPGSSTLPPLSCPITYKLYVGEKVIGLTKVPNVSTLEACLLNCNNDNACVGFDYNKMPGANDPCWKQTDNTKTRTPENPQAEQVTHYSVERTCSGCRFNPFSNSRPTAFTIMAEYKDEEQCVGGCSTSATCKASAFQNNQCLHGTGTARTVVDNSRTWMKSDTCTGTETSTTLESTTATVTVTDTPTGATQGPTEGLCSVTYIRYPGQHVSQGTRSAPNTNNATCAAACDANTACVGYDINPTTNACWIAVNRTTQRNPVQTDSAVDHFTKVSNCEGVCYRMIHDSSFGTSASFGEGSKNSCLLSCKNRSDCRDVIYNPTASSGRCRLVGTGTPVIITDLTLDVGTTFYSRLDSCNENAQQVG